jgi:type I restriction enzyme S subunit
VPVPPLAVQAEIVRILDSFTSLEAELEAELEARKKQYEYYRDRLLSEDGHGNRKINDLIQRLCPDGVRKYKLHDIAEYSSTRINSTKLDGTSFVGVDNLLPNKAGRVDASYSPNTSRLTGFSVGDLLIGNIRPYLKKIWIADREGGCSGDVLAVHVREEYRKQVHPRFFYYLLSSDRFFLYDMQYVKGAKMPRGNKDAVMKFCVLVPPLVVQAEIVAVLDKFDALVNDLSSGLPAEIAARRKQYEYYRDRLLSFKELRDE